MDRLKLDWTNLTADAVGPDHGITEAELEALDGEFLVVDEDGPDCHVVWCAFGGRVEVTTAEGAEGFLGGAA